MLSKHLPPLSKHGSLASSSATPLAAISLQVDAARAKAQRLGGADATCPVSLGMVEEWEAYKKGFKREIHDNMGGSSAGVAGCMPLSGWLLIVWLIAFVD